MKFENSNGHTKDWSDVNHNAEQRKVLPGRMSYITVTENAIKWWVTVNGLNHHEVSGIFYCCYEIIHHVSSLRPACCQRRCLTSQRLMMTRTRWWSSASRPGRSLKFILRVIEVTFFFIM